MAMYGYDALVSAAEDAEARGNWRRAYDCWSEVIAQYGNSVSSQMKELWEYHQEMCRKKMK